MGNKMSDTSKAPSTARRLDIQGLRAVAVLMVVGFHAGLPIQGGFVGVDVFFVISGFVITSMLLREAAVSGRIRLGTFYVRRFKRLIPALATMVGVVTICSLVLISPMRGLKEVALTGLGAMTFTANIVLGLITGDYFGARATVNPLLHTWSLSVEEQFYFVFPVTLVLALILSKRIGHLRLTFMCIVGLMAIMSLWITMADIIEMEIPFIPDYLIGFYSLSTRIWEFAAGVVLAILWPKIEDMQIMQSVAPILAFIGTSLLLAPLWLIGMLNGYPEPYPLLPVLGTTLVIASGIRKTLINRVLGSRIMVAIGDGSYSIYLWHWPFIVFARLIWSSSPMILVFAALLSLVPAYLSYRWVEQPLRLRPAPQGVPLARFIAMIVVPALVSSSIASIVAKNNMWNDTFKSYASQLDASHTGLAKSCFGSGWQDPTPCTWNRRTSGRPIYLVGDSNAGQFSDALIGSSTDLSRPLVILSRVGCPYPDIRTLARRAPCTSMNDGRSKYLLQEAEPGVVILASAWWIFLHDKRGTFVFPTGKRREQVLSTFSERFMRSIREMQAAGHTVVLVQTIPHWKNIARPLDWDSCSVLRLAIDKCIQTMPVNSVSQAQRSVAEVIDSVGRKTGVPVLDVSPVICPENICSTVDRDGMLPFQDDIHITVGQSKALTPFFTQALSVLTEQR